MSYLPAPKLDDRDFQTIVDEIKQLIPAYLPNAQWTDHNVSDPGIMIIELFAHLTETILYRVNQVPQLNYIKFLEMLGLPLASRKAAIAAVTLEFAVPITDSLSILAPLEVTTRQSAQDRAKIFTIEEQIEIVAPQEQPLLYLFDSQENPRSRTAIQLAAMPNLPLFGRNPSDAIKRGAAVYFAFSTDVNISDLLLEFQMTLLEDSRSGSGYRKSFHRWEAAKKVRTDGSIEWVQCPFVGPDKKLDAQSLTSMKVQVPENMQSLAVPQLDKGYWLRLCVAELPSADHQATTPIVNNIAVHCIGKQGKARHLKLIHDEFLGISDGSAGQTFQLKQFPIVPGDDPHVITVSHPNEDRAIQMGDGAEVWKSVSDFSDSGPNDPHFVLDHRTGQVRFAPALVTFNKPNESDRERSTGYKTYGKIPRRGMLIHIKRYNVGGGEDGNVRRHEISELKTAQAGIHKVWNGMPAEGGANAQDLESLMMQAPGLVRANGRAVTRQDYEQIALERGRGLISRAICLQPEQRSDSRNQVDTGDVFVLLLGALKQEQCFDFIEPQAFLAKAQVLEDVEKILNTKRLLTTRLQVTQADLTWALVEVEMTLIKDVSNNRMQSLHDQVKSKLFYFLNPVTGGREESGWPFGRHLYTADIYHALREFSDEVVIQSVQLFRANNTGQKQSNTPAGSRIAIAQDHSLASGKHHIKINRGGYG